MLNFGTKLVRASALFYIVLVGVTAAAQAGPDPRATLRTFVADSDLPAVAKQQIYEANEDSDGFGTRIQDLVKLKQSDFSEDVAAAINAYLAPLNLKLGASDDEITAYAAGESVSPEHAAEFNARVPLGRRARTFLENSKIPSAADLSARFTIYDLSMRPGLGKGAVNELKAYAATFGQVLREGQAPRITNKLSTRAQRAMTKTGAKNIAEFARLQTFRELDTQIHLNWSVIELLEHAQSAGHPVPSGAVRSETSCLRATRDLSRGARNALNRMHVNMSPAELSRQYSLLEMRQQNFVSKLGARELMDWALICGHPLAVTSEEREVRCGTQLGLSK